MITAVTLNPRAAVCTAWKVVQKSIAAKATCQWHDHHTQEAEEAERPDHQDSTYVRHKTQVGLTHNATNAKEHV